MTDFSSKFLPYGRQTIEADDIEAVTQALQDDFLTTGPKVAAFEKLFAETVGSKEAVAVGNGTHALHLACLALGLGEGDYAIVPAITFLATANAIRYCGADVIFADVDPLTGLMTPDSFQQTIDSHRGKNIKAVLPVHLGGHVVDLASIQKIAQKHNIKIIADACHALGGSIGEHAVGSCFYEDMATFSFHPVKNITMGEGGAITTNDTAFADKMRSLRSHGMIPDQQGKPWSYEMEEMGYNYRVTDIQCALGLSQLKKLDRFISKRCEFVEIYNKLFEDISPFVKTPVPALEENKSAWHLYALRIDFAGLKISRAEFMNALKARNIGSQVHYIPVSSQPYYTDLYGGIDLPGAEIYYEATLSIPLFPTMTKQDAERVVDAIKDIIS